MTAMTDSALDGPPGPIALEHADRHPLRPAVVAALRSVFDPEIPVNIFDLGLIYRLDIDGEDRVDIEMTVTAPNCPVADMLPGQVRDAVAEVAGVAGCEVALVWDPPWDMSRMTDDARMALDIF